MRIIILLTFILFSNNIFAKTITMCNRLELLGYVNHARISNSTDFNMTSRGKYDLEILSTNSKDNTQTELVIDTGMKKQLIIINNCESKDIESSIDLNY